MPHVIHYTKKDIEAALYPNRTLAAAGELLGITRERVRQLAKKYDIQRRDHRRSPLTQADQMDTLALWDAMTGKQQATYARRSHWPREGIHLLKRRLTLCMYSKCLQPHESGKAMCLAHLTMVNRRAGALRAKRKASHLCIQCGKPLASESIAECDRHLRKNRYAGRRRREAQRKLTSYDSQ